MKKTTLLILLVLVAAGCVRAQYCMLPGQTPYSNLQPGITNFKLNTIDRNSGNSENANSVVVTTGQTTTLSAGQMYTISISHSEDNQFFAGARNNLRVWIDYNNNFSYLDAGETVLTKDLETPATTYTATFTVPATTPPGTVSLRATAKMSNDAGHSLPTPCNVPADPLGYHGEMEDYTIVITSTVQQGQAPTATFAVSQSTLCRQATLTVQNTSTGDPVPTFTWSSNPSAGVTFMPANTSSNPSVKFANAGTYTITCVASNSVGSQSSAKTVTVGSCIITGLESTVMFENVSVFPCPVNDRLVISLKGIQGQLTVINGLGQVCWKSDYSGDDRMELDTREWPGGIYSIVVAAPEKLISKSVMIAH